LPDAVLRVTADSASTAAPRPTNDPAGDQAARRCSTHGSEAARSVSFACATQRRRSLLSLQPRQCVVPFVRPASSNFARSSSPKEAAVRRVALNHVQIGADDRREPAPAVRR
jgi:hypothetical protein